jgi:antitoxin component YwqK of YwqJK toxin-antitoxin module
MNEDHESQTESNEEIQNGPEPDMKAQIKMEIKEELKQAFLQRKRKKLHLFLKLVIVFLLGLCIGFLAGSHNRIYHHGYMMNGRYQLEMQNGMQSGNQFQYFPNSIPGQQ